MADDQSDEILSRLRGISSDEKSELGKLKCRIDDQARLIMMLKKRNDEYILANMALDKHSIDLENQIELFKEQFHEQEYSQMKIQELTQMIEQLKLTNFQWEFKEQQTNQRFISENDRINQIEKTISHLQQQIQSLEQLLKESNETNHQMEKDFNHKLLQKQSLIDQQHSQLKQIQQLFQSREDSLKEKDEFVKQIDEIHQKEVHQRNQIEQKLKEQIQQLQKRLQESSNQEDKLRQQLKHTEQLLINANQRFINDEERVNCDSRVQQIQMKYHQTEQKLETLQQEFVAYKNYTTSLLNKEKHLNERLQLLLTGKTT